MEAHNNSSRKPDLYPLKSGFSHHPHQQKSALPNNLPDKKAADPSLSFTRTGKVLIMDDDVIVRTVAETLLTKAGYIPVGVSSGREALARHAKALSEGEPFLVTIMDLTIPGGMGGKETLKKLREIDPQAKVIAFSGFSNDPVFTDFKKFGFDGVLSKPFSVEEFLRAIASVLDIPPVP